MGIGLVTPSAPAPARFPDRYKRGVNNLESLGFTVKCGAYVTTQEGLVSASAKDRASDINRLFLDEDVSLLMATIGGYYSAEVLPHLDWEAIRANKKGMIGYSDITVLLHAIGIKAQQVVYYGPTLMTEFAEYPRPPLNSQTSFLQVFNETRNLAISPISSLLAKGVDWSLPPEERVNFCPVFQQTIRPGQAQGIVLGGCMEALDHLRGTEFWPNFKNSILLLETIDDDFIESKWRSFVADYTNMGVFNEIVGVVIGQKTWNEREIGKLSSMLLDATNDRKPPILYGLPFGHISPIATLPLFTRATLDSDAKVLTYKKPFIYEYIVK